MRIKWSSKPGNGGERRLCSSEIAVGKGWKLGKEMLLRKVK